MARQRLNGTAVRGMCAVLGLTLMGLIAGDVYAGPENVSPKEIADVGIDEHAGARLPLDLPFVDEAGRGLQLAELFKSGRPVLLTFNYSDCPMLCSLQLNGLVTGLKEMTWGIGREFDIITVGLNPNEAPARARQTKERYCDAYGKDRPCDNWHFLTGPDTSIRALAAAAGFKYTYIEDTGDYAHSPAVMVITPEGIVSRYLYGVVYDAKTVRLSLVEAAAGRLGSPLDKILLYCFHYDAEKGRYAPAARNVMKAGGALTILLLGCVVGAMFKRDRMSKPNA